MFIRRSIPFVMALTLMFSLTGCMTAGDEAAATAAPTVMPVVTAEATGAPAASMDWNRDADNVEAALEQLSEIETARVAVSGDTALVGVKFDPAYKGEMTERIRGMIDGVVKKADPSIQNVTVTAVEEDVDRITEIAERVRAGAGEVFDDFKDDIETIIRNATTNNR